MRAQIGQLPLELHSHCTIGLSQFNYMVAAELGIDALHVALGPLAHGSSLPCASQTIANLRTHGHEAEVNQRAIKSLEDYYFTHAAAEGLPIGKPQNLVPAITQSALGLIDRLTIHGTDYPTRDGSCLRDFIHVCDLARAHTQALQYLQRQSTPHQCEAINLGSGDGITVLEAIHAFEEATDQKLDWIAGPRRPGDVMAIYANNEKAQSKLGWSARYNIQDIMATAWNWECRYRNGETVLSL